MARGAEKETVMNYTPVPADEIQAGKIRTSMGPHRCAQGNIAVDERYARRKDERTLAWV